MSFLETISSISVRKVEVTLPIARLAGTVTPLLVGDDLSLKSSMVSPVNYERDIVKLLHKHTDLIINEEAQKLNFNDFTDKISNIDKISLLWGLYKATYKDLGEQRIICDNCEHEFKAVVDLDNLIQPDTYTLWEEDKPFYEYVYAIPCIFDNVIYVFYAKIPSMRDHIRLLSIVPTKELRNNVQNIGAVFTKPIQHTLLTSKIQIYNKPPSIKTEEDLKNIKDVDLELLASTESIQEILIAFENHIPFEISEKFINSYNDKFDKYTIDYYTIIDCPSCGNEIRFDIDIEMVFLRRTLFGREQTGEEL